MSKTPRTDARWEQEWRIIDPRSSPAHGMLDLCEQLEEELTTANERIRELESQSDEEAKAIATVISGTDAMIDRDNRIRELEAENDTLKKSLADIGIMQLNRLEKK